MKKYLVDDTAYWVNAQGDGPILLFAHGFPFDDRLFEPVVDRLASKFHCVVPDLRGFGKTGLGANGHNLSGLPDVKMGRFADDLAILGAEIACERGHKGDKFYLCGLSMGGYILLEFLRSRQDMLLGGIFCDSNAAADNPEKIASRLYLADTIAKHGMRRLAESMVPSLVASETLKDRSQVVSTLTDMITSQDVEGIAAASRGMAERRDLTELLASVQIPILVLGGAQDKLSPPSLLDEIAAAIPQGSRATIPSAGHVPSLENPDAFADAILDWYAKIA